MGGEWEVKTFADSPVDIIDGDRGKNYPKQSDFQSIGHCLFLNAGNVTKIGFDFSNCAFIVMPNHIHGIIYIVVGAGPRACPGQPQGVAPTVVSAGGLSLPDVVHRLKTMTAKKYADRVKQLGWSPFPGKLWQRNYWEHIVRNEQELNRIRAYIRRNPVQWATDKLHQPNRDNVREFATEYAAEAWMV